MNYINKSYFEKVWNKIDQVEIRALITSISRLNFFLRDHHFLLHSVVITHLYAQDDLENSNT